jgi:hypothetical protein
MNKRVQATAIVRIRKDVLCWDNLSEVDRTTIIVVQNVLLGSDTQRASDEVARLNALNEDAETLYIQLHARVRPLSNDA